MRPAVSIILPTFNRLQYLPAAVESVFNQSFHDWELLIADDGSGPETRAYLQTLEDPPRVKVLWFSHTGNPPAIRNSALREAQGEYVAFLDSDDLWQPNKLELQIESLRHRMVREWSYTGYSLVNDSGGPLSVQHAKQCPVIDGRILDQLVKEEAFVMQSSVLARRELVERVGGYDEGLPVCGDYELWIRLAVQSEVDFVDKPLVFVRRHAEHYSDDVTALQDLAHALMKITLSGVASHLDSVLRNRRANVAANLARGHALARNRLRLLSTFLTSIRFSWRYPRWWFVVLALTASTFIPSAVLKFLRRYRSDHHVKLRSSP